MEGCNLSDHLVLSADFNFEADNKNKCLKKLTLLSIDQANKAFSFWICLKCLKVNVIDDKYLELINEISKCLNRHALERIFSSAKTKKNKIIKNKNYEQTRVNPSK